MKKRKYGTVYGLTSPWHRIIWNVWHFSVKKKWRWFPRQFISTLSDYLPGYLIAQTGPSKTKLKIWTWRGHLSNPRCKNMNKSFLKQYKKQRRKHKRR